MILSGDKNLPLKNLISKKALIDYGLDNQICEDWLAVRKNEKGQQTR